MFWSFASFLSHLVSVGLLSMLLSLRCRTTVLDSLLASFAWSISTLFLVVNRDFCVSESYRAITLSHIIIAFGKNWTVLIIEFEFGVLIVGIFGCQRSFFRLSYSFKGLIWGFMRNIISRRHFEFLKHFKIWSLPLTYSRCSSFSFFTTSRCVAFWKHFPFKIGKGDHDHCDIV